MAKSVFGEYQKVYTAVMDFRDTIRKTLKENGLGTAGASLSAAMGAEMHGHDHTYAQGQIDIQHLSAVILSTLAALADTFKTVCSRTLDPSVPLRPSRMQPDVTDTLQPSTKTVDTAIREASVDRVVILPDSATVLDMSSSASDIASQKLNVSSPRLDVPSTQLNVSLPQLNISSPQVDVFSPPPNVSPTLCVGETFGGGEIPSASSTLGNSSMLGDSHSQDDVLTFGVSLSPAASLPHGQASVSHVHAATPTPLVSLKQDGADLREQAADMLDRNATEVSSMSGVVSMAEIGWDQSDNEESCSQDWFEEDLGNQNSDTEGEQFSCNSRVKENASEGEKSLVNMGAGKGRKEKSERSRGEKSERNRGEESDPQAGACGSDSSTLATEPQKQHQHQKQQQEQRIYTCVLCSEKLTGRREFVIHLQNTHRDQPRRQCAECGKVLKSYQSLTGHMRVHSLKRQVHQCSRCDFVTLSVREMEKHKVHMHNARDHLCSLCGKAYKFAQHLRVHISAAHQTRKYPCDQCDKRFLTSKAVDRHRLKAHKAKQLPPLTCEFCSARFYEKSLQEKHMKLHAVRWDVTVVCGETFSSHKDLCIPHN